MRKGTDSLWLVDSIGEIIDDVSKHIRFKVGLNSDSIVWIKIVFSLAVQLHTLNVRHKFKSRHCDLQNFRD